MDHLSSVAEELGLPLKDSLTACFSSGSIRLLHFEELMIHDSQCSWHPVLSSCIISDQRSPACRI